MLISIFSQRPANVDPLRNELVGEMVDENIHFPSPKPKLNLEEVERRFRSASMTTGD